jgi:hypothetical protein
MRSGSTRRRLFGLVLVAGLTLGFTPTAGAQQQPATLDFNVTENRVPEADGSGTITPQSGNQLRIEVHLTGMPPNSEHAMHIHLGNGARCDTNAPIVYPLNNVQVDAAGTGTSTSTITLRADQPVRAGNAYINVHQAPTVPSPGIICANIDATFEAGSGDGAGSPAVTPAGPGGSAMAMPGSGTGAATDNEMSVASMLALGGLALALGTWAFARRARRTVRSDRGSGAQT